MSPTPARNPRVLLVEDDAAIMSIMVRYLGASGYETEAVESVAAALRSFAAERPAIIVTDIFFESGDDGFSLIEEVRARDWRFVGLGLMVLALLGGSVVLALRPN